MSLESQIFSAATGRSSSEAIANALSRLERAIERQISFQPVPFIFLKSNNNNLSSNVANNVLILNGTPVPANSRATVRDFNINFTTVAGTVRIVILDSSGSIKIDVLRGINSSTNGVGETVLEEGEMLAVVGQSAGAGVFSVYCSGETQRIR
jgi:hypothetical protein